jgi:hypothetical protein
MQLFWCRWDVKNGTVVFMEIVRYKDLEGKDETKAL